MELKIDDKTDNKLLKRLEVAFTIVHKSEATPSRLDVRGKIAAKLSKDEKLVVIPKLVSRFGEGKSIGVAHVYKSEKDKVSIEPKYVLKRYEPKAEKEKKEAPVEDKKEETPAEEKEESKPEEASGDSKEEKLTEDVADSKEKVEEKPAEEVKEEAKKEEEKAE